MNENNEPTNEQPAEQPGLITCEFVNGHDIGGAKIIIQNITPEQIVVAIFHLERAANQLYAAMELQARMEAEQKDGRDRRDVIEIARSMPNRAARRRN